MIVGDLKTGEFAEGDVPTDSPPPYASSPSTDKSPSISRYTQPPSLPHQNHLSIKRTGGPLKGTWIINPDLKLPEAVFAPLEPNEVRKNLEIVSDFGPFINAEVWVVGNERTEDGRAMVENVWPATVNVTCKTGGIKVRMNADEEHRFRLVVVTSHFGKVTILLPRTFVGPLIITTRFGPLFLVGSIKSRVATFSDVKSTFKGFIGNVESSGFGEFHSILGTKRNPGM